MWLDSLFQKCDFNERLRGFLANMDKKLHWEIIIFVWLCGKKITDKLRIESETLLYRNKIDACRDVSQVNW